MADVSIVQSAVQPNANTQIGRGTVGGSTTITQGQAVYLDPATLTIMPAKADSVTGSVPAANLVGVALDQAAPGQPITYALSGDLTLTNAPLTTDRKSVV